MKRPNLYIKGIEKGEESQDNNIDQIINRIVEENVPKLRKDTLIQIQEEQRTPNRQDQKRNSPCHIRVKTLNVQNKERILKGARQKQGKSSELQLTFQCEL